MSKKFADAAANFLFSAAKRGNPKLEFGAQHIEAVAAQISERMGQPILPGLGETVAVAVDTRKTYALFFDRIWALPVEHETVPSEIVAYGATEMEVWMQVIASAPSAFTVNGETVIKKEIFDKMMLDVEVVKRFVSSTQPVLRGIAQELGRDAGMLAIPVYENELSRDREYTIGDTPALISTIDNLQIVEEEKLSWEQVRQFRSDAGAKTALRRLRKWADDQMIGKSLSQVSDTIAVRLEDYEAALKKHGVETISGCMSDMLDPKFVAAASVLGASSTLAGGSALGVLATSGLVVGKTVLSVGKRLFDAAELRRSEAKELGFVLKLKELAKP